MKTRRKHKSADRLIQARSLLRAGRFQEAAAALGNIVKQTPNNHDALELLAELAFKQGDLKHAARMLERVVSARPESFSAHNKLAVVYASQARFPQAASHLRTAIDLKPDHLPAYIDLCKVNREMGLLDESIKAGLKAVSLAPEDPRTHSTLAISYEGFGQHDKAHTHHERAAELAPNDIARQFACGVSRMGAGKKEAARQKFQEVIDRQADHAQARWMLARLTRYQDTGHEDFKRLQTLLENGKVNDDQRSYLHFALGKMYDDCGHYDEAFAHFAEGNRIENARYDYNPEQYSKYVDRLIECFTPALFEKFAVAGSGSQQPVFIVGMPRSGTTLVEQILASHSGVFGAGELSWFAKTEKDLCAFINSHKAYPLCVSEIDSGQIKILADKYLAYLSVLSDNGGYRNITDKMPSNYERVGLISLLFPNARIIHCRRNPLDNAVSQFSMLFQGTMEYSRDLYNLGTHYADYERLMAHWKACRPDSILDVQYEALVDDHESGIRRLLEFVGLGWEEQCLRFFESKRAVRTSSDFQVRQPIYSTSIARWKHYDKFLEPLRRGLQHQG